MWTHKAPSRLEAVRTTLDPNKLIGIQAGFKFIARLNAGSLDALGPQRLEVVRQKLIEDDTVWLYQLAHSRDMGRVLGYVVVTVHPPSIP